MAIAHGARSPLGCLKRSHWSCGSTARVQGIRREEEVTVVSTHCSFKVLIVKGKREMRKISFQRVKTII